MALHARLVPPPPPPQQEWPYHTVKCGAVLAASLFVGERRMDAEAYLSSGVGVRSAMEGTAGRLLRLGDLARFWMPPRLKQVLVAPDYGVPYLNTSQVFDIRPSPRKWLASAQTAQAELLTCRSGDILVMRSASPGRTTVVTEAHEGCFITDHFMRVELRDSDSRGWVYAFLLSPQGQAMMQGSQYASIIRHIEPRHMEAIPIPTVPKQVANDFTSRLSRVVELRNKARCSLELAEDVFASALGHVDPGLPEKEAGFEVQASHIWAGRRRLEGSYHTPCATALQRRFKEWEPLAEVSQRVWWMSRFKRVYGDGGLPYLSADELFTVNPQRSRFILVDSDDNHEDYFVKRNWILMACSGQVYGLNGAAILATEEHEGIFFSHDLIRIVADEDRIRPAYLLIALTHPTHGRPLLIRAAYGTSIPHLDPGDVAEFPVVRLGTVEGEIADLAEASVQARTEADRVERAIAADAGEIVERFIKG